jgi:hypothetical protein
MLGSRICSAVELDGRYQLVAVDEHHRRIDGTAYACVGLRVDKALEPGTLAQLPMQQVLAMARTNADLARLLIAQAAVMLEAAGTLLGTTADTDLIVTAIRELVK